MPYPVIQVAGDARERGVQYGAAAADRIRRSVAGYAAVFEARLGYSWPDVVRFAGQYRDDVGDFSSVYLTEMDGIAAGADLDPGDILALNVRTEMMARALAGRAAEERRTDGCTSVAVLPQRAADGELLIGQTWDWLVHSVESVVVLEVRRDDGPNYVTVVEAGLLAKSGMNSAGLALCSNFLLTNADGDTDGVPYHLLLRAIMDAETVPEAYARLQRARRAASANYLLGHADGLAVSIESAPGAADQLFLQHAEGAEGLLVHANHYNVAFAAGDVSLEACPDSPFRQQRLGALLSGDRTLDIKIEDIQRAFGDHASFPRSICAHGDLRLPAWERETSAFGLIMEPASRRMFLADGNPCAAQWRELTSAAAVLTERREPTLAQIAPALLG